MIVKVVVAFLLGGMFGMIMMALISVNKKGE